MCVLIMKFFLSENKIKETSNNNQIYSFFETCSCWTLIFDYFTLRMQAGVIFKASEMDFKVEAPWNIVKYCQQPW